MSLPKSLPREPGPAGIEVRPAFVDHDGGRAAGCRLRGVEEPPQPLHEFTRILDAHYRRLMEAEAMPEAQWQVMKARQEAMERLWAWWQARAGGPGDAG